MISRLEAIDIIKQLPLYRYECEVAIHTHSDIFKALEKAITDMQKMEKIEHILTDTDCSKCGCKDNEDECNECRKDWITGIKQIVKGEE